ncbi:hypothetical protein [Streptomyces sp. NBC_00470]|uniref:hypothetical protein n=1 Tax=Streptomyces sp. NBC_00470 TaxID=2975753 RepID=UPI002F916BEC
MTTPTPLQTEPTPSTPTAAAKVEDALYRYNRLSGLGRGLTLARSLDAASAPPPAGPRDLAALNSVINKAREHDAAYLDHPEWRALRRTFHQVEPVLAQLGEQAERTPGTAVMQAATITTLSASFIARCAARVNAQLTADGLRDTPGAEAIRVLIRTAEDHAAQASGLHSVLELDTPRTLSAHMRKVAREVRKADKAPEADTEDPELEAAAAEDPGLAGVSQLMNALSELAASTRQAGRRLTLDVRLHGTVGTLQLRGYEMLSGIARAAMRRYDNQDRGNTGRRDIAARIFHYAEQHLERLRGTLPEDAHREVGHYEAGRPGRYQSAIGEASRTITEKLRNENLPAQDRTELQIQFLLVQREMAAEAGDLEWGTRASFPPNEYVAGRKAGHQVDDRLDLIDALQRHLENTKPSHPDFKFLNSVKERFQQEIAGPPELTAEARRAELSASQVRAVAEQVVRHGVVASPLALSEVADLDLTHAQAERALDVLETFEVVGSTRGTSPRQTLIGTSAELNERLVSLEPSMPGLLEKQSAAAPAPAEVQPTPQPVAPAAAGPSTTQASDAGKPELPRRDRSVPRRHPGNLKSSPPPAEEAQASQHLIDLIAADSERSEKLKEAVLASKASRSADRPASTEAAVSKAPVDEAQRNAQHQQRNVGACVR